MANSKDTMFDFLSNYISKKDIYSADAIAKISMFIFKSRKELNMTQKQFAIKMGVTQSMVSKWESATYNFTIENIAQIAEKLNMTFDISFRSESDYIENYRTQRNSGFKPCNEYKRNVIKFQDQLEQAA